MPDDRPGPVDAALRTYVGRQLLAREALEEPQYRMQFEWLRQMLAAMDEALDAEHVPANIRERVIHRVLYGCAPDEQFAMDRLADHLRAYEEIRLRPLDPRILQEVRDMAAPPSPEG